jgi:hypothetical protein
LNNIGVPRLGVLPRARQAAVMARRGGVAVVSHACVQWQSGGGVAHLPRRGRVQGCKVQSPGCMEFGFGVWGVGFGSRLESSGFRVRGQGFEFWSLEFEVWSSGVEV